ncbi:MAG: gamma-glutamyl-phosphate reductase, partial [Myxococcales bacterium]|nr:gamma-glutamyl-phosphate reductase [Myxococcales bacterium]
MSARGAGRRLAALERAAKDAALAAIARRLRGNVTEIGEANAKDVAAAREAELSPAMINRLEMTPKVVESTAAGVEFIAGLPDPVGSRAGMQRLQNGLLIGKQR